MDSELPSEWHHHHVRPMESSWIGPYPLRYPVSITAPSDRRLNVSGGLELGESFRDQWEDVVDHRLSTKVCRCLASGLPSRRFHGQWTGEFVYA